MKHRLSSQTVRRVALSLFLIGLPFLAGKLAAQIEFPNLIHDFGTINEGTQAQHTFAFKNIGQKDLTLTSVKASCGCTTPSYTQTAVKPGETGKIDVSYNSSGRPGEFTKSITVMHDGSDQPVILTIRGNVTPANPGPAAPALPQQPQPAHDHNHDGHHNHDHDGDGKPDHHGSVRTNRSLQRVYGIVPFGLSPSASLEGLTEGAELVFDAVGGGDEVSFKDTVGKLAFDKIKNFIGILKSNESKDFEFKAKNVGTKPITFLKNEFKVNAAFELTNTNLTVKPGEVITLTFKFVSEKAKDNPTFKHQQSFNEVLTLKTDEADLSQKNLYVNGTYERVWSEEELANAPVISFDMTEFDGGEILQGQKLDYVFKFKNTGKSDLVIESAKASCGCTASAPADKVIKPGATSEIRATFDSTGKNGAQHKTVTVTSNDPKNPRQVLHLRCTIKADPFSGSGGGNAPVNLSPGN